MAPAGNTTDQITAAYATAPLGNNSKLSTIELSGLHNTTQASARTDSSTTPTNQFTKISTNC